MKEARGRAGKDCLVRGRHGDAKAKSEEGILSLRLPFRIRDVTYPCPLAPPELPLTGPVLT